MILDRTAFGDGVFPDVAILNGLVYLAVREGDPRRAGALNVWTFPVDGPLTTPHLVFTTPLAPGSPAFPRLSAVDDRMWLGYHDSAQVQLRLLNTGQAWSFAGFGNSACCFGFGWFAWQAEPQPTYRVRRLNLRTAEQIDVRLGAPTGLSRVLASGAVVTVDEDRHALAGASIPCFADDLAVGEGPTGGVVWQLTGARGLLWTGLNSFEPRCATTSSAIAVCTAGPDVRVFAGTRDELRLFVSPAPDPIPVIGKPLWLGWFEFADPPILPPGNALLKLRDGARLVDFAGRQIAQYVQGGTVEDIERQAAQVASPVVYWDARHWPRWPALPQPSWLGLQAYCHAHETPLAFEQAMRAIIASAPAGQPLALICQCYTSNAGHTQNLSALVPVYAALARDVPKITMLLAFSDHGRTTGLQDHPSVRGRWQELANGITGIPGDPGGHVPQPPPDNGIVNGVCVNPKHYFQSLTWDKDPRQYREVFAGIREDLWRVGMGFQTRTPGPDQDLGEPTSRIFLPTPVCPNAAPPTPEEKRFGVKQDEKCWDQLGRVADTVENDANGNPIAWAWVERGVQPYQPIPSTGPVDPEPGAFGISILAFDPVARRSDPNGMLIRFEILSERPIVKLEIGLDDGEPAFRYRFEPPPDGRYLRALAWKPVRNGTYRLQMKAWDDQEQMGQSDGSHEVTVIP